MKTAINAREYIECSALRDQNVQKAFEKAIRIVVPPKKWGLLKKKSGPGKDGGDPPKTKAEKPSKKEKPPKAKEEKPVKAKADGPRESDEIVQRCVLPEDIASRLQRFEDQLVSHEQQFRDCRVEIRQLVMFNQELGRTQSTTQSLVSKIVSENEYLGSEVARLSGLCEEAFPGRGQELQDLGSQTAKLTDVCKGLIKRQSEMQASVSRIETETAALRDDIVSLRGLSEEEEASRKQELQDLGSQSERLKGLCNRIIRRVATMEAQVAAAESEAEVLRAGLGELRRASDDQIESHEERVEALYSEVAKVKSANRGLEELESHEERLEGLCSQVARLQMRHAVIEEHHSLILSKLKRRPAIPVEPQKPLEKLAFPIHKGRQLDGIISHLTKEAGGDVHEKGFVTITSRSVSSDHPEYCSGKCADLTGESEFESSDEPGQWICWDFHDRRVSVSHYTLCTQWLKSWVLEGSLDGRNWQELDRRAEQKRPSPTSFAVSTAAHGSEHRFLRLTQTDKNRYRSDILVLNTAEFFGTLLA
jgi:hypothetical protein